ncbi:MAG: hypothetical protein GC202_06940 [Alphaproteobacteria bacterium]|nr:hypothetical protein [Alphaproteobacteria bacterium]
MKLPAALLFCLISIAARAQAPAPAELDQLYAAGKYRDVVTRMIAPANNAEARAVLGWAQARVQDAAPHVLSVAYSDMLWKIGQGQASDPLREESVLVLLYAILAVGVDGAKCADTAAPDARVRQILSTRQDRIAFARKLPAERRKKLRDEAVALEQTTASRRPEDLDICASGPEEIGRQLATPGTTTRELPLRPGEVRRTIDIEPGPGYKPRLLAPSRWHARQAQVRSKFEKILDGLVPA